MSDNKSDGSKLTLNKPKLELKKTVDGGQVRQNFSHGRSKTVAVEVKKKRSFVVGGKGKRPGAGGDHLTSEESQKRARVLAEAKKAEVEAKRQAEVDAQRKAEEDARRAEEEAAAKQAAEEEAKRQAEAEAEAAKQAAEEKPAEGAAPVKAEAAAEEAPKPKKEAKPEAKKAPAKPAGKKQEQAPLKPAVRKVEQYKRQSPADVETEEARRAKDGAKKKDKKVHKEKEKDNSGKQQLSLAAKKPAVPAGAGPTNRRRSGKMTVTQALSDTGEERQRSLASVRRAREKEKKKMRAQALSEQAFQVREVVVPEAITVQELANRMAARGVDVIKALMKMGVMATINQTLDQDTAELLITEFGHKIKRVSDADVEDVLLVPDDVDADKSSRAPVVTVMGHVDHGKTSLLDALRATDVVSGEAGGITQHIGAYQIHMEHGGIITFLDTPGHEAFTAMRARGAKVTDIVVLVVAADDGIMPQTLEAIHHAKAAEVPIIVAVNKIDKPAADPQRVRNELLQHDVIVEDFGGDVMAVDVSAKARLNLEALEEAILLQAEMLELKANPTAAASGSVVEAQLDKGRGSVATLLVTRGTLKVGDIFVAGAVWGRVRALVDDHGQRIDEAGPSVPVEVLGLQGTPVAGDDFAVVETEAQAREIVEYRERKARDKRSASVTTLEQMFSQIKEGKAEELPLVIKADVQGSVEAIQGALDKISTDEVKARVLHSGVGAITESDVTLARASNALILGFNVRANAQARDAAQREGTDIRYYSIIYDLTDDMKGLMSGMLAPEVKENFIGYVDVQEVFNITKVGRVAGAKVAEGVVRRDTKVRLLRDNVVLHEGMLGTLKRFKDDVKEVKAGMECGIALENYQDIQAGDVIEVFEVVQEARTLD